MNPTTHTDALTAPMSTSRASTYQQVRAHLAALKLDAAPEHLPTVLATAQAEGWSMTATLEQLLAREVEETEARKLAGRLRFASLPTPATRTPDMERESGLSDERCFRRSSQRVSAAGMRSAKVTAKALSAGFHRMVHRA